MIHKKLRFYLDTTVPNYLFAVNLPDKMICTQRLFEKIRAGKYEGYISDIVIEELLQAEEDKRNKLLLAVKELKRLSLTEEIIILAEKYVKKKIISKNYLVDARHVAIATVNNLDALISWNYRHLVNINKIRGINIVNEMMGYKHIEIISPEEV